MRWATSSAVTSKRLGSCMFIRGQRDRRSWFQEMLLGWLNRLLLLSNKSASILSSGMAATYTKPRLISPQTAAFVDNGILTFQTTWIGRTVQITSVATAYAGGYQRKTIILCSSTDRLEGICCISALWRASSGLQTCRSSML